jgi:hypothetical protein
LAAATLAAIAVVLTALETCAQEAISEAPITQADREHWAFGPLSRPPLFALASKQRPARSAVDLFILAKLKEEGSGPAEEADGDTLLRRLSFDLTGLPPSDRGAGLSPAVTDPREGNPAPVEGTSTDGTLSAPATDWPDEYERQVDRLLASPAYGERWAQHWLDLARFAETDGFEHDKLRPDAWKYRDWVIAALNADMPYDEFVRLQLAGDVDASESGLATLDTGLSGAIATTFCLAGPDMPDLNSQEERRHYVLNELAATVGAVFLGLQVGCAQCHDHKYDPISQADFYRLRAFFEPAVHVKKDVSLSVLREEGTKPESRLWIRGDHRQPGPLVAAEFPRIANAGGQKPNGEHPRLALARWLAQPDHPLTSRVMANRIWQHHFGRGIVQTPSDFGLLGSPPTHPELLDWLATELVRCGFSIKTLHRRIVHSATYRQAGDVQSPRSRVQSPSSKIQSQEAGIGAREPSPQSEVGDPQSLYARFPRQRLSGETIRDAMLATAGLLDRRAGGSGVMLPLPQELAATLLKGQWKEDGREANHYRRSIYLFARRNLRYPIFETFDRPDANASCPARSQSTTALQSLQMVNSEFTLLCARHLAGLALHSSPGEPRDSGLSNREPGGLDPRQGAGEPPAGEQREQTVSPASESARRQRLGWLVRRAFGREARRGELEMMESFLQRQTELLRREGRSTSELALPISPQAEGGRPPEDNPYAAAALVDLCLALYNASEFCYVD